MDAALRFFNTYELWIYLFLGLGGLYFAFKFARAWNELRSSAFGLERESAQNRLNKAASVMVLIFIAAIAEFALVSFAVPAVPGANPLLTPTLDLLATQTATLPPENSTDLAVTPTAENLQSSGESSCIPDQVMLTEPQDGSTVEGIVPIIGSASIPNFGFYKFEMAKTSDNNWLSVEANNQPVVNNQLGNWNTSRLDPGAYQLRLVVTDNEGQALPPCIIQVNVVTAQNP
ncbi:MAG: hypothetical protein ACK2UW_15035 [Anaerolineales bacterium]|jgi:hypothetical protein